MDLYCGTCGEPWDIDCIHEIAEERALSYDDARRLFKAEGCKALGTSHNATPVLASDDLAAYGVLSDLLGDDMDGIAAMMEDYFAGVS